MHWMKYGPDPSLEATSFGTVSEFDLALRVSRSRVQVARRRAEVAAIPAAKPQALGSPHEAKETSSGHDRQQSRPPRVKTSVGRAPTPPDTMLADIKLWLREALDCQRPSSRGRLSELPTRQELAAFLQRRHEQLTLCDDLVKLYEEGPDSYAPLFAVLLAIQKASISPDEAARMGSWLMYATWRMGRQNDALSGLVKGLSRPTCRNPERLEVCVKECLDTFPSGPFPGKVRGRRHPGKGRYPAHKKPLAPGVLPSPIARKAPGAVRQAVESEAESSASAASEQAAEAD